MSSDDKEQPVDLNSVAKTDYERKLLRGVFKRDWNVAARDKRKSVNNRIFYRNGTTTGPSCDETPANSQSINNEVIYRDSTTGLSSPARPDDISLRSYAMTNRTNETILDAA